MTWWEEIYDKVYVPRNEVGPGTTYAGGVI